MAFSQKMSLTLFLYPVSHHQTIQILKKKLQKAKLQFNIYLLLMQYLDIYYLSMYQEVYMEQ
jgi:hypothetical protein